MSKTIRGIRDFIAGNTIIGRLGQSSGPPGPISITDLLRSDVAKAVVSNVTPANPTATAGPTAVNGSAITFMRSDAAPAVQKASSSQFGIVEVDGTTITASGGVISAVEPVGANPTATAGPTAVNGTAKTFMTSDSAPAVQTATIGQLGLVQPDGTTITIVAGVISAVSSGGFMLPLINGDTPGPALMADPDGQCIGVPL